MADRSSSITGHLATLDGLRGVAALAVLLIHTFQMLDLKIEIPHAPLAVDFFFMLSGFVIAKAYETRLKTSMRFSQFVKIRLVRLYPMIFISALMGTFVLLVRMLIMHSPTGGQLIVATVSALLLIPSTAMLSLYGLLYPVNPPQWSLFFELAINFVYAPLVRWLSTGRLIIICILSGVVLSFAAAKNQGLQIGVLPSNFLYGFARVTFPFFMGVLLHRYSPRWRGGNCLSLLLAAILGFILFNSFFKTSWIYDPAAVIFVFPLIIFCGAACQNSRPLNAVCLGLGELSYPLYMTHHPILRVVFNIFKHFGLHMTSDISAGLYAMACVFAAVMLMKVWDQPIRTRLARALRIQSGCRDPVSPRTSLT